AVHPHEVKQIANEEQGILSVGFFAQAIHGAIQSKLVFIKFDEANKIPVSAFWAELTGCMSCGQTGNQQICAAGKRSVRVQFCSEMDAKKSVKRMPKPKKGWTLDEQLPVTIAMMTAHCDLSDTVGGDINALEITAGGNIHWLQRYDHCPDNID